MRQRHRIGYSKSTSAMGFFVGIVFLFLGFTMAIPTFGGFGIVWTLIALGITGYHAFNLFSEKGLSTYNITTTTEDSSANSVDALDSQLRKLKQLKDDGLITDEEYEQRRAEIMKNH